jgi:hypothetical protein
VILQLQWAIGDVKGKANSASTGILDKQESHRTQCVHNDASGFSRAVNSTDGRQQKCSTRLPTLCLTGGKRFQLRQVTRSTGKRSSVKFEQRYSLYPVVSS